MTADELVVLPGRFSELQVIQVLQSVSKNGYWLLNDRGTEDPAVPAPLAAGAASARRWFRENQYTSALTETGHVLEVSEDVRTVTLVAPGLGWWRAELGAERHYVVDADSASLRVRVPEECEGAEVSVFLLDDDPGAVALHGCNVGRVSRVRQGVADFPILPAGVYVVNVVRGAGQEQQGTLLGSSRAVLASGSNVVDVKVGGGFSLPEKGQEKGGR